MKFIWVVLFLALAFMDTRAAGMVALVWVIAQVVKNSNQSARL